MRIAVISDTHDNWANIDRFFSVIQYENIEAIVHCGDITNGETLEKLATSFPGEIHLVYGNAYSSREDMERAAKRYGNVYLHGDEGEVEFGGKKIAFCHKPKDAKRLSEVGDYDYIFYGDTHKPWIDKSFKPLVANPGTLAGMFTEATFAVCDLATGRLELKILNRL